MGCINSSLRGEDVPSVNAKPRPSYMRNFSNAKPQDETEHYETPQEHQKDLDRVQASQQDRRASRPAYVDPDDQPPPPKTKGRRDNREQSETQTNNNEGWKERANRVRGQVAMPDNPLARRQQNKESNGAIVANNARHSSYIG